MWVRRTNSEFQRFAIRFEVDQGKGVLRVTRPGVLIVPPARQHGHEDHLSPDQVRASVFLFIPSPTTPRQTFALSRLSDPALTLMDTEVWYELSPVSGTGSISFLELREADDIIELAGTALDSAAFDSAAFDSAAFDSAAFDSAAFDNTARAGSLGTSAGLQGSRLGQDTQHRARMREEQPLSAGHSLADVAGIVDRVSARAHMDEALVDDLIEADPETAASAPALDFAMLVHEDPSSAVIEGAVPPPLTRAEAEAEAEAEDLEDMLPEETTLIEEPTPDDLPSPIAVPVPPTRRVPAAAELPVTPRAPAAAELPAPPKSPSAKPPRRAAPPAEPLLAMADEGTPRLVRHMRRELSRERLRVEELLGRIQELEARLRAHGLDPD